MFKAKKGFKFFMSNVNKISLVEAIALVLIIIVNRLSVNMPQNIVLSCCSSAVLNAIYVSVLALLFIFILVKLFKRFPECDIMDISEFAGGKFFKNVICIILFLYLISIVSVLLRDFSETLKILYYIDTPIIYILMFFIGVCLVSNLFGGHSIVKTNLIICVIMLISLIVSYISVLPNAVPQRVFPILGYGAKQTFFYGITNIFAFNGLFVLYFLPPMLANKKDFKKLSIISILICAVLIISATASLLLAFSFSTQIEKISSLYMLLSNNEFGKYLQHPESLFAFTWILSFMSYLNICCMLLTVILKKFINVKNEKPFIISICLIIFIIAIIPRSIMQAREIENTIYKFIALPLLFIVLPIILFFANKKYKKLHKNNYDITN